MMMLLSSVCDNFNVNGFVNRDLLRDSVQAAVRLD